MPLLVPMIDSFRQTVRLYEILKAFLLQINTNEKDILALGGGAAAVTESPSGLPSDGNDSEVLTFVESPEGQEWKGPHEIDTFVSEVF